MIKDLELLDKELSGMIKKVYDFKHKHYRSLNQNGQLNALSEINNSLIRAGVDIKGLIRDEQEK